MKLLFFLPNNVSFGKFKTAEPFFFMIITELFLWFERLIDSIILSKNDCTNSKKKDKTRNRLSPRTGGIFFCSFRRQF